MSKLEIDKILNKVRSFGGRITPTRKNIIDIIHSRECLISHKELLDILKTRGFDPNRSTIFRELSFLINNNIIKKNNLNSTEYYEIQKSHHHHLVCSVCNSITKVEMDSDLSKQEKIISDHTGFKITEHSLEFYGFCPNCKS